MRRAIKLFFFFLLVVSLGTYERAAAQSFDYERYPRINFSVEHLDLTIDLFPGEMLLEGEVEYTLVSNIADPDSIVMQAAHMDIQEVKLGNEDTPYHLHNDSLIVTLPDSMPVGSKRSILISYRTSPRFGIHRNANGTIWTSFLPLSNRHWFPGLIHPRVASPYRMTLTLPAERSAHAAGQQIESEATAQGRKQVQWVSKRPLPSTQLWFATGIFSGERSKFGAKTIRVLSEERLVPDSTRSALLREASGMLKTVEDEVGYEFPYDELTVLVLNDHRWEERAYAPGLVILSMDGGSLEPQLNRGIYAQWFGSFLREEQWRRGDAFNLYQTALHYRLESDPALFREKGRPGNVSRNPYATFSPERWNRWQQFYPTWSDSNFKRIVEQSFTALLAREERVYNWDDLARFWYRRSGQPLFERPEPVVPHDTAMPDSVLYRVTYQPDETSGSLALQFESRRGMVNELVTLPVVLYTGTGTDTTEVTFTGGSDTVHFNFDPSVRNVTVTASGRPGLYLEHVKPPTYLLYQLRNAETTRERLEAAQQLGVHSENPDLQLAITDMLEQEENEKIRAALLRSFSQITRGASGTEQVFLDKLYSGNTRMVRVALKALGNYEDNPTVASAVSDAALEMDSLSLFKSAVDTYVRAMEDTSQIIDFASRVIETDTTGNKSIYLIDRLSRFGFTERAVKQASYYLGSEYIYPVRKQALLFMVQYDRDGERWNSRFQNLLRDNDPRIRFLAVSHLPDIREYLSGDPLKNRMLDEYDGRVYYEMKRVMEK